MFRTKTRKTGLRTILKRIVFGFNDCFAKENVREFPQVAIFAFDHIGMSINVNGRYEKDYLEAILQFLGHYYTRELETALDIGANIGNHSLFLAPHFRKVFSFEPNPRTYALLSINTQGVDNIATRNIGLGSSASDLTLIENKSNIGGARIFDLARNALPDGYRAMNVKVESLDDQAGLVTERIDLIKIDVEGYESEVIRGSENTIRRNQPVIVFEQHAGDFVNGRSETIDRLEALGYEFLAVTKNLDLGQGKIRKAVAVLLRAMRGEHFVFVPTRRFAPRFYPMIVGIPKK